ncbi:hypothetical protein A7A09_001380 [Paracoccus methylarcula]|uniref:Uncharacterized protein n=1 Tax=Paracoccus methylarcula TaxID=72022 RepID=A0A422R1I6_9RHOB|nr:hypothetical protein A7A09_001380 [Paracoccus methylarcula]
MPGPRSSGGQGVKAIASLPCDHRVGTYVPACRIRPRPRKGIPQSARVPAPARQDRSQGAVFPAHGADPPADAIAPRLRPAQNRADCQPSA